MNDHQDDLPDVSETNPHAALWKSENYVSPSEQAWDRFYDLVERLLGHDLDGDQAANGYSIDFAFSAFEAGETAEAYVAEVNAGENYKPASPVFRVRELPAADVADYVAAGAIRAPFQLERKAGCLGFFPVSVHTTQAEADAALVDAIGKGEA